jgi:hypothetical protein
MSPSGKLLISPGRVLSPAAWDQQVLQSIKRTVTKLHFLAEGTGH